MEEMGKMKTFINHLPETIFLLIVTMLLPACGVFVQDGPWDLTLGVGVAGEAVPGDLVVFFPDQLSRDNSLYLGIWAFNPKGNRCSDFISGDITLDEVENLAHMQVKLPLPQGAMLSDMKDQSTMFVIEATDANVVLLRGCVVARARKGMDIQVLLQCVCQPVPGVCAAGQEQPNNGIDDDCDGLTDECTRDTDCNDDNGCTQDFCLESECHYSSWPNGLVCDDGDRCTNGDACQDGECIGTMKDCSEFDRECIESVCNEVTGQCESKPVSDGTRCDDGLYCTSEDSCIDGVCAGHERECDDGNPCTNDTCDENAMQCKNVLQPKPGAEGGGSSCTDGEDNDCDGLTDDQDPNCNVCHINSDCNDNNECTTDVCNLGTCHNDPVADSTPCTDDGLFCNGEEKCLAGVCTSFGDPCPGQDGDDDCRESCDESSGTCHGQDPENSGCDDGLWCTVSDHCSQGNCVGVERDCADGEQCTQDSCDDESDRCVNEPDLSGQEGPTGEPTCGNGVDDDCDGLTDTDDSDCSDYCGSYTCWSVSPTGQDTCYDNQFSMSCPGTPGDTGCGNTDFCGQDAQYEDNSRSLSIEEANGDYFVEDSLSGLAWQQNVVSNKTWNDANDYCNELSYAGYDDWRLPNYYELVSIVDYGDFNPSIDSSAFPGTSGWFWSSSSFVAESDKAWSVSFGNGSVQVGTISVGNSVRCVRNGSTFTVGSGRFVEYGSEQERMIKDQATGYVWQKGSGSNMPWKESLSYCENLSLSSHEDWRLPNINELKSLVDVNTSNPASGFPGISSVSFWSSSSLTGTPAYAWRVDFDRGTVGGGSKTSNAYVRCVRTGP